MQPHNEDGYLSIGIILTAAIVGLGTMANLTKKVDQSVHTSKVRQASLEGEELALYSFTVARQLFDSSSGQAALGLVNDLNPAQIGDIELKKLDGNASPLVRITGERTLIVYAPNVVGRPADDLSAAFSTATFTTFDRGQIPIQLTAVDFESWPSGYGVKSLVFKSQVPLPVLGKEQNFTKQARIPMPTPTLSCQIMIDGQTVSGSTVTRQQASINEAIMINAQCQGAVLAAHLEVDLVQVADAVLPQNLKAIFTDYALRAPGQYTLQVRATRVDAVEVLSAPITLSIQAPLSTASRNDYMKCLYKCQCGFPQFVAPQLCAGTTDFVNPFHEFTKSLDSLPEITGNPLTDPAALATLEKWAYDHGAHNEAETHGAKLQGTLYPGNGYGTKLACSKVGGGGNWLTWAFDPNNNCQEEFIGSRGSIGCLVRGSRVMIGPQEFKAIEELNPDDRLWNPRLQRFFTIQRLIRGQEEKALHTLYVSGRSLVMTYDHPVLTDRGYRMARDLIPSDRLWVDERWMPLTGIRIQEARPTEVWNLIVQDAQSWDEHVFFVEGVAVGDLWMQERMRSLNP
jgi:hypothetical protein